jgi:hypothetical protein
MEMPISPGVSLPDDGGRSSGGIWSVNAGAPQHKNNYILYQIPALNTTYSYKNTATTMAVFRDDLRP